MPRAEEETGEHNGAAPSVWSRGGQKKEGEGWYPLVHYKEYVKIPPSADFTVDFIKVIQQKKGVVRKSTALKKGTENRKAIKPILRPNVYTCEWGRGMIGRG